MTQSAPFYGWGAPLKSKTLRGSSLFFRALFMAFGMDGSFLEGSGGSIHQSTIGYFYTIGGASGGALILTYGGPLWFPVITILMLGAIGQATSLSAPKLDPDFTDEGPVTENSKTIPRTLLAAAFEFSSFMVLYWVLSPIGFSNGSVSYTAFFSTFQIPFANQAQQISSFVFLVFTVPYGEENFFRAMWGNLVLRYLPPGVAEPAGGVIFMVFHSAVYSLLLGPSWGLIILLSGAGTAFIAGDEFSGDIGSSLLGHSWYNGSSVLLGGSIITKLFGLTPPVSLTPQMISVLVVPVAFVMLYKKGGGGPIGRGLSALGTRCTRIGRGLRPVRVSLGHRGVEGAGHAYGRRVAYADGYGEGSRAQGGD